LLQTAEAKPLSFDVTLAHTNCFFGSAWFDHAHMRHAEHSDAPKPVSANRAAWNCATARSAR